MFKQMMVAAGLVLALLVSGRMQKASAQDAPEAVKMVKPPSQAAGAYRLNFSVNEIEDGKKINSRQYSLNLTTGDSNEIKIGTRVPFEQKPGEFTYIDVGTSIWCRLVDRADQVSLGDDVSVRVRSEISNFAVPEQQSVRPLLRQLKIDGSTIASLGKTAVVGSVDDPNSKRQFQLEVTVTKLR